MQPDFREVAESIGLQIRSILSDDRIHRCATVLHPKKLNGSYRTDGRRGHARALTREAPEGQATQEHLKEQRGGLLA